MKKWLRNTALPLSLLLCGGLLACGRAEPAATASATVPATTAAPAEPSYLAEEADIAALEEAYRGRTLYFGEMHDHAATGGTSDGKRTLAEWKTGMEALDIDFATIVDHKQSAHMYLEDWDETLFIGGSEPGTTIQDLGLMSQQMHYNMIFSDPAGLEAVVREFTEFGWKYYSEDYSGANAEKLAGGWHFGYPNFTKERMMALAAAVREQGGLFVHVHPKSRNLIESDNPLDYWYGDETGLEVFYGFNGHAPEQPVFQKNYKLWTDLLALGKRVWATAGSDQHNAPNTNALTAIYAEEKQADSFLSHMRQGDFVCGFVGIRMVIGDATMGGETSFAGERLVFSIDEFHSCEVHPIYTFRVDLLDENGVVFSQEVKPGEPVTFALDARADAEFYRVEVHNTTFNFPIALGNPIWNR